MFVLDNHVQHYAWGDAEYLPDFLGKPNPSGRPWAEVWMGAHPSCPSRPAGGSRALDALIAEDPAGMLGAAAAGRFDGRLPFLFKVLTAARPLSIQVHPDKAQAARGWARENAAGLPLDSPLRLYRDDNHKPEIICALTPFEALCGFRPVGEIVEQFSRPAFAPVRSALGDAFDCLKRRPCPETLRDFFTALMRVPPAALTELMDMLGREDAATAWFQSLAAEYPGDRGALAPFYLNHYRLQPGQALYQPAGVLHAFLRGAGVELMANSDNVLRGGCTAKRVDVDELLAVMKFESGRQPILEGELLPGCGGCTEYVYRTSADEFVLSRVESTAEGCGFQLGSGEILLCVGGSSELCPAGMGRDPSLRLRRGESAFIPASTGSYEMRGNGCFFRARVPQ